MRWLSAGLAVESAKDYAPKKGEPDYQRKSDVPWIRRFAEAGGKVIVSGNTDMAKQPHERKALVEAGLVTIFFEPQWSKWPFFRKCSLLIHWWPAIVQTAKSAKPGTFWRVPSDFNPSGVLRQIPNEDAQLQKIARQLAQRDGKRAERRKKRAAGEQAELDFDGA